MSRNLTADAEILLPLLGLFHSLGRSPPHADQQGSSPSLFIESIFADYHHSQYNTALQLLLMLVTAVSPIVPHDFSTGLVGLQYVIPLLVLPPRLKPMQVDCRDHDHLERPNLCVHEGCCACCCAQSQDRTVSSCIIICAPAPYRTLMWEIRRVEPNQYLI
jgi:hypothetical protein